VSVVTSKQQTDVEQPAGPTAIDDAPDGVSVPCAEGRHRRCTGKVARRQLQHGKRYVRCKCPTCNHPPIRTRVLKK
jgi:hypothetical protein